MKLTGRLRSGYKSFPSGFEFEIDGPIAILSGVNGSGKSQLFDIIRRKSQPKGHPKIALDLVLDGQPVGLEQVSFRSFREGIQDFKNADPELIKSSKHQIHNHYRQHLLNPNDEKLRHHRRCAARSKEILIEVFGHQKFHEGKITAQEIENCASLGDFIWKTDDIFENVVSEVFYNFALKKLQAERAAGRSGKQLSFERLGDAPWTKLNDLFSQFNFGYRFKSDYEIAENSFSLSAKPMLHQTDQNGEVLDSHSRELNDLSDGERAIMSLALSSLSGKFSRNAKLILLDEFDATLNPSLIKILYGVLDEYFVKKSIMVILITHSSSTISMAPDGASFYEVFNPLSSPERILRVQRDDYHELKVAHERLFQSISNQSERIRKLIEKNSRLEQILSKSDKPKVLVEGPTDICYIKKAAELLNKEGVLQNIEIQTVGIMGDGGTKNSNNKAMRAAGSFLKSNIELMACKILLLHDPEEVVEPLDVNGKLYIRSMTRGTDAILRGGVEALFPATVIDRARAHNPEWFKCEMVGKKITKLMIVGKKTDVCRWICDSASEVDFAHFSHIFEYFEDVSK